MSVFELNVLVLVPRLHSTCYVLRSAFYVLSYLGRSIKCPFPVCISIPHIPLPFLFIWMWRGGFLPPIFPLTPCLFHTYICGANSGLGYGYRVVIVTGAGRLFCAGADLKACVIFFFFFFSPAFLLLFSFGILVSPFQFTTFESCSNFYFRTRPLSLGRFFFFLLPWT